VNVPPARVESENPTATVPAGVETVSRAAVADPRSPSRTVPIPIAPRVWTAFNFATSTLIVTERLPRSKFPESAGPLTV